MEGGFLMNNIYPIEIYKDRLRKEISSMLGIPDTRCDLSPDFRGSFSHEDIIVENGYGQASRLKSYFTSYDLKIQPDKCLP